MIKIIGLTHAEYSIINPFWWDDYELGFCDQTGKIFRDGSTHYERQGGAGKYRLDRHWTPVFKRGEFFGWTEAILPDKIRVALKDTAPVEYIYIKRKNFRIIKEKELIQNDNFFPDEIQKEEVLRRLRHDRPDIFAESIEVQPREA
jgi:hypothetical protein